MLPADQVAAELSGLREDPPGEVQLAMHRAMLLARMLDERMWQLNRAGKLPFVISCQGHEAAQVGSAFALERGRDFVLPYYRGLATVLVMGMEPVEVLLAAFARANDPNSGGRQMPGHYSCRRLKIVSQSSPVGTQIPHAAGVALAERLRGGGALAWVSFGEGATSQGDFHEGLNLAAVHRLAVVFQCENNEYAISVPQQLQMAVSSVAERAVGCGVPGITVDGTDVLAVYEVTRRAVVCARRGDGPMLIEARVTRLTGHSSAAQDETGKALPYYDPLVRFRTHLYEQGLLDEAAENGLREQISAELDAAVALAESAPLPEPGTLFDHVYAE